jgi:APA family basic amino acid/polyamine antiporter
LLYFNLPLESILVLPSGALLGLVIYFAYGYRKSHVGRGLRGEVHELDDDAPPTGHPPVRNSDLIFGVRNA